MTLQDAQEQSRSRSGSISEEEILASSIGALIKGPFIPDPSVEYEAFDKIRLAHICI